MTTTDPPTFVDPDSFPAEQFEDTQQQRGAVTLGMWAFIAQEVLFLGAVFVSFYIYRLRWPDAFAESARDLKWQLGTLNTAVLLGSSYTMALAVHAAKRGNRKALVRMLLLTLLLGATFLGIKFTEYVLEFRDHLVPGLNYALLSPQGVLRPEHGDLFMTFYFVMTGLHALHMIIGLGLLAWLARQAHRNRYSAAYHSPVEMIGLYWHFVDLVWVFLFPTLYLLRHP